MHCSSKESIISHFSVNTSLPSQIKWIDSVESLPQTHTSTRWFHRTSHFSKCWHNFLCIAERRIRISLSFTPENFMSGSHEPQQPAKLVNFGSNKAHHVDRRLEKYDSDVREQSKAWFLVQKPFFPTSSTTRSTGSCDHPTFHFLLFCPKKLFTSTQIRIVLLDSMKKTFKKQSPTWLIVDKFRKSWKKREKSLKTGRKLSGNRGFPTSSDTRSSGSCS